MSETVLLPGVKPANEKTLAPGAQSKESATRNVSGSVAVMDALLKEEVNLIFGYPGGAIMPIYDALYD